MADAMTRGFIKGTEPIALRMRAVVRKASTPTRSAEPIEELRARLNVEADALIAEYQEAMKRRPVS